MRPRLLVTLFALGMASSALVVEPRVAEGKDKPTAGTAGTIEKATGLSPKGLHWGLTLEGVAKIYDKVFEDEYLPLLRKAQPGQEMQGLEDEQKTRQGILRRGRIDFGTIPTGVDQSPLKGEYSYNNAESMATLRLRSGTERHFFFFSDKLWKVYDEHKLKKGSALGETYEGAVKVLATKFGSAPKKAPASPEKGQSFDESVWTTPDMIIRAIDRGNVIAVVYADRETQEDLPKRRRNKPKNETEMDKDVANALKKSEAAPDPKKGDKKPKK